MNSKPRWSVVALLSPIGPLLVGLGAARGIANEKTAMRVVAVGGLCFLLLSLVASCCAFRRKERLRWFTPLAILAIVLMFTLGVSTSQ